jgi:hypothetical protein
VKPGVPCSEGSTISFSVSFALIPHRMASPVAPTHACTLQALGNAPPADATKFERRRDATLRFLASHKIFEQLAVVWAVLVVSWILFVVVLFAGPILTSANTGNISDGQFDFWTNVCFQVLTALFSYQKLLTFPWRLSVLLDAFRGCCSAGGCCGGCSRCCGGAGGGADARSPTRLVSSSPRKSPPTSHPACGVDFYGRPTEAVFFHIPCTSRRLISALLFGDFGFHYLSQITRMIWPSAAEASQTHAAIAINATFGLSILCGLSAAVVQGAQQGKLHRQHPERFPPPPFKAVCEACSKFRKGELATGAEVSQFVRKQLSGQALDAGGGAPSQLEA